MLEKKQTTGSMEKLAIDAYHIVLAPGGLSFLQHHPNTIPAFLTLLAHLNKYQNARSGLYKQFDTSHETNPNIVFPLMTQRDKQLSELDQLYAPTKRGNEADVWLIDGTQTAYKRYELSKDGHVLNYLCAMTALNEALEGNKFNIHIPEPIAVAIPKVQSTFDKEWYLSEEVLAPHISMRELGQALTAAKIKGTNFITIPDSESLVNIPLAIAQKAYDGFSQVSGITKAAIESEAVKNSAKALMLQLGVKDPDFYPEFDEAKEKDTLVSFTTAADGNIAVFYIETDPYKIAPPDPWEFRASLPTSPKRQISYYENEIN